MAKTDWVQQGPVRAAVEEARHTLREQMAACRRRQDEVLMAELSEGFGRGLTRAEIFQRARLADRIERRRVWVYEACDDAGQKVSGRCLGTFFCTDLRTPGMHARCVTEDAEAEVRVFDPAQYRFETRAERTLRFAEERLETIASRIDDLLGEAERTRALVQRARNEMERANKARRKRPLQRFVGEEER